MMITVENIKIQHKQTDKQIWYNFITHLYIYVDFHLKMYLSTSAREKYRILHLGFLITYRNQTFLLNSDRTQTYVWFKQTHWIAQCKMARNYNFFIPSFPSPDDMTSILPKGK